MIPDNETIPEHQQDASDLEQASIATAETKEQAAPPTESTVEPKVNTTPDTTAHTQHAPANSTALTDSPPSDVKSVPGVLGVSTVPGVSKVPAVLDQLRAGKPLATAPRSELMLPSDVYKWDDDLQPAVNYFKVGARLAKAGDLYRAPGVNGGLIVAPSDSAARACIISTAGQLAPLLVDRLAIQRFREGRRLANRIPNGDLTTMLRSEAFLRNFQPLDRVTCTAMYMPDFTLTKPGYNDGGEDQRVFYTGAKPVVKSSTERMDAFLDVMAFDSNADRTNALAAALTVLLRNFWPGGKPLLAVTATKSHAGKDTVVNFACGRVPHASISYDSTNWAFEKVFAATIRSKPELGVVNVENARLSRTNTVIHSAFLERFLTDPNPILCANGNCSPEPRRNDLVVAASTNFGSFSTDLLNRALPIHLAPLGNVQDRKTAIGNPKEDYLPVYAEEIEAELRGMIEKWKAAGRPLAKDVRHPFTLWAQTVGGILRVNGRADFLANYAQRKSDDDDVRRAIGLLGAATNHGWLKPEELVALAKTLGLVKKLIPEGDRDSERSQKRGIGTVLSCHVQETFIVLTDDARLTLQLEKARLRFDQPNAQIVYRFVVKDSQPLAEDAEPTENDVPAN